MFTHVTVGSNDLERSAAFYDGVLGAIGLIRWQVEPDGGPKAVAWVRPECPVPRFYVYQPFDGGTATDGNGTMASFFAPDNPAVTAAYQAALRLGGTCEGPPGPRPHYGEGYFGAYFRDPDGNKLHVLHRPAIIDLMRPPARGET